MAGYRGTSKIYLSSSDEEDSSYLPSSSSRAVVRDEVVIDPYSSPEEVEYASSSFTGRSTPTAPKGKITTLSVAGSPSLQVVGTANSVRTAPPPETFVRPTRRGIITSIDGQTLAPPPAASRAASSSSSARPYSRSTVSKEEAVALVAAAQQRQRDLEEQNRLRRELEETQRRASELRRQLTLQRQDEDRLNLQAERQLDWDEAALASQAHTISHLSEEEEIRRATEVSRREYEAQQRRLEEESARRARRAEEKAHQAELNRAEEADRARLAESREREERRRLRVAEEEAARERRREQEERHRLRLAQEEAEREKRREQEERHRLRLAQEEAEREKREKSMLRSNQRAVQEFEQPALMVIDARVPAEDIYNISIRYPGNPRPIAYSIHRREPARHLFDLIRYTTKHGGPIKLVQTRPKLDLKEQDYVEIDVTVGEMLGGADRILLNAQLL
jgi:hypothetical protein